MQGPEARRRRRGEVLEAEILSAAWQELEEHGWAGLRMERVAMRARTGKTSVYSRWPSKASLVRAATTRAAATVRTPVASSGDLRADLRGVLRGAVAALDGPYGEAVRGLVAEARAGPSPASAHADERSAPGEQPIRVLQDAAVEAQRCGQLPPGDIPIIALNLGVTLVTHHCLMHGTPPDEQQLELILDVWLPALGHRHV